MSGPQFWALMERWRVPDEAALALIGYPGKLGKSGKRPRFRFTTRQQRLSTYLLEIEDALAATGTKPDWLRRPIRGAPFNGCAPLTFLQAGGEQTMADVLRYLNRHALMHSLHALGRG